MHSRSKSYVSRSKSVTKVKNDIKKPIVSSKRSKNDDDLTRARTAYNFFTIEVAKELEGQKFERGGLLKEVANRWKKITEKEKEKYEEMAAEEKKKLRVMAYVDGSNLYFGMIESGARKCKWLDVYKLMKGFVRSNQELIGVKFFTSRITHNPPKEKRQTTYLEALESTGVELIYGSYHAKFEDCRECGHQWVVPSEKMTDVNLATHLLMDAHLDAYDVSFVVSGDTDFTPCVEAVNESFADKSVVMLFPPLRENDSLEEEARSSQLITKEKLIECQLPMEIIGQDGIELHKPFGW